MDGLLSRQAGGATHFACLTTILLQVRPDIVTISEVDILDSYKKNIVNSALPEYAFVHDFEAPRVAVLLKNSTFARNYEIIKKF